MWYINIVEYQAAIWITNLYLLRWERLPQHTGEWRKQVTKNVLICMITFLKNNKNRAPGCTYVCIYAVPLEGNKMGRMSF